MQFNTTHKKNARECLGKCAHARETIEIMKLAGIDTGVLEAELDTMEEMGRRVLEHIERLEEERKGQ